MAVRIRSAQPRLKYRYDDAGILTVTATPTSYIIGTNANAADPDVPIFTSRQLVLVPSEDCWVRINGPNRVEHFLQRYGEFMWHKPTTIIYYRRATKNGLLFLHAEGI